MGKFSKISLRYNSQLMHRERLLFLTAVKIKSHRATTGLRYLNQAKVNAGKLKAAGSSATTILAYKT
jgi:hypothetical protein